MQALLTVGLTIIFTSAIVLLLVFVYTWSNKRLGNSPRSACEIMEIDNDNCCKYASSCPEEIRTSCKHAKIRSL
ncbi:MAG: hypothetical protein N3G21_02545 [Candidatus Hydrogenedentes bacterium]|nr:hypothetical protein [Candidatus Hydrogenedentota bacterium]